jgi:hypothetical protein
MKIDDSNLNALAQVLMVERRRQKLSREEAAAVCGVSASFIRDAESCPENCSLGKLVKLVGGLGLNLELLGLNASGELQARSLQKADFGVPSWQQAPVNRGVPE